MMSSKLYIERYEEACKLAGNKEWEAALEAYQHVFDPLPVEGDAAEPPKGVVDSDLLGAVEIYKADCLRMLGRLEEAKQTISAPVLQGIAPRLSTPGRLYEYFAIYGLILGELGDLPEMGTMFLKALNIASNALRDVQKVIFCWNKMFGFAIQHHDWNYLLQISEHARQLGKRDGIDNLVYWAEEHIAYAYKGLGNKKEAERAAAPILKRYREAKRTEKIAEWDSFLASLR
ncbi:MAG: hypothetical protein JXA21_02780 [Anaerolineae bacterium]|nr:hypothetical protein [Anaerolineae bacterium]